MKINTLVNTLNIIAGSKDFISRLDKIRNHTNFHRLVADYFQGHLPEGIKLFLWELRMEGNKIIKYSRDFKPYNIDLRRKGRFKNLKFEGIEAIDDMDISVLSWYFQNEEEKQITIDCRLKIVKLKEELRTAEKELTILQGGRDKCL